MIQPIDELENFQKQDDPWGYNSNPDDAKRKDILLSEVPWGNCNKILDIGCGQGFVTFSLPGEEIIGVDISHEAIKHANKNNPDHKKFKFIQGSIFEIDEILEDGKFDLILITGVLYPQYIGNSQSIIYPKIDKLLNKDGLLVCVHINDWYSCRFPLFLLKDYFYDYRNYVHKLEVYTK